jgi:penicillin-binding protein 2
MFIFDLLKNQQQRVRVIAAGIAAGLVALLGGLWFVQVVSAKHFEMDLQRQSFRTVRVSAVRGRILDRTGLPLAENRPHYNAVVYLEELRGQFDTELEQLTHAYVRQHPEIVSVKHKINLKSAVRTQLQLQADYRVVSNLAWNAGALLQEPRALDAKLFLRQTGNYPYMPFQILTNLAPRQVAIFAEQLSSQPALELETQPVRSYPHGAAAAHLVGYVQRKDNFEDEEFSCQYRLPDYEGKSGVEGAFDSQLRGQPGIKSVLVNNRGYRQREETITAAEGGEDIWLTIDLAVQQAAEKALAEAVFNTRGGAAVVMDVRNGDILALASAPAFDPNVFITGISESESQRLNDEEHSPQLNRAVDGAYPPGSTFKIITAIACLESRVLDPNEVYNSPGEYSESGHHIADTAGPGEFNFERAFYRSSNTYFIHYGMKAGLRKLLEVAKRFHLGEKTQIGIHPEAGGHVPGPEDAGRALGQSSTPDVCIGQEIDVSPLQMAVMTGAIANGGTLFWPRLISHSVSPDSGQQKEICAAGRVRERLSLDPRHLEIIRQAMLADTEHGAPGDFGTAYEAFHAANREPFLADFRVAGKTGTAQVESSGKTKYDDTWFVSFGPYENPRYAVVVMVDHGASGGRSCAPVARKIYQALIKSEQSPANKPARLADSDIR